MRLIDGDAIYKQVEEAEELAQDRVIDTKETLPFQSYINPAYTRYLAQVGERTWMKHMIANAPTVGAASVAHGWWETIERREPLYDISGVKTWGVACRCSECGFVHTVIEDFGHYSYCPSCGAKMDGDT